MSLFWNSLSSGRSRSPRSTFPRPLLFPGLGEVERHLDFDGRRALALVLRLVAVDAAAAADDALLADVVVVHRRSRRCHRHRRRGRRLQVRRRRWRNFDVRGSLGGRRTHDDGLAVGADDLLLRNLDPAAILAVHRPHVLPEVGQDLAAFRTLATDSAVNHVDVRLQGRLRAGRDPVENKFLKSFYCTTLKQNP